MDTVPSLAPLAYWAWVYWEGGEQAGLLFPVHSALHPNDPDILKQYHLFPFSWDNIYFCLLLTFQKTGYSIQINACFKAAAFLLTVGDGEDYSPP